MDTGVASQSPQYYKLGCDSLRAGHTSRALEHFSQVSFEQLSALERLALNSKLAWCRANQPTSAQSQTQAVDQAFAVLRQCVILSSHVRDVKTQDELADAIITSASTCLQFGSTSAQMNRCAGNLATAITRLPQIFPDAYVQSTNQSSCSNSVSSVRLLSLFRIASCLGTLLPDACASFPIAKNFSADEARRRRSTSLCANVYIPLSLRSYFGQHHITLWLVRTLAVIQRVINDNAAHGDQTALGASATACAFSLAGVVMKGNNNNLPSNTGDHHYRQILDSSLHVSCAFVLGWLHCDRRAAKLAPMLHQLDYGINLLRNCARAGDLRTALQCHVVASHALLLNNRPRDALQQCELAMLRTAEQQEQQQQHIQQTTRMTHLSSQQQRRRDFAQEHIHSLTQQVFVIAAMAYRSDDCRNEEAMMLELAITTPDASSLRDESTRHQNNGLGIVHTLPRIALGRAVLKTSLWTLRAESLLGCARVPDALTCLINSSTETPIAPQQDPTSVSLHCFLLLDQNRFEESLLLAQSLLEGDERDWTARLYAADALVSLGKPGEAVSHLRAIVNALAPQRQRLTARMRGVLCVAENNLAVACSVMTSSIASSPITSAQDESVILCADDFTSDASFGLPVVGNGTEALDLLQRASGTVSAVSGSSSLNCGNSFVDNRNISSDISNGNNINRNSNNMNDNNNNNSNNSSNNINNINKTCDSANTLSVFNLIVLLWQKRMYRQACVLWLTTRGVSLELSSATYARIRQELQVLQRPSQSRKHSASTSTSARENSISVNKTAIQPAELSLMVCASGSYVVDKSGLHNARPESQVVLDSPERKGRGQLGEAVLGLPHELVLDMDVRVLWRWATFERDHETRVRHLTQQLIRDRTQVHESGPVALSGPTSVPVSVPFPGPEPQTKLGPMSGVGFDSQSKFVCGYRSGSGAVAASASVITSNSRSVVSTVSRAEVGAGSRSSSNSSPLQVTVPVSVLAVTSTTTFAYTYTYTSSKSTSTSSSISSAPAAPSLSNSRSALLSQSGSRLMHASQARSRFGTEQQITTKLNQNKDKAVESRANRVGRGAQTDTQDSSTQDSSRSVSKSNGYMGNSQSSGGRVRDNSRGVSEKRRRLDEFGAGLL